MEFTDGERPPPRRTKYDPLPSVEMEDEEPIGPVHELRKTVQGRIRLYQRDISMKGYSKSKGSRVPFQERRFVAWDGESIHTEISQDTVEIDGAVHPYERAKSAYVLFGNSDNEYVYGPNLSTIECLSHIIAHADKDAIHIGFAFGYDVNMILRDLSKNHLRLLKEKGSVLWKRWRIAYLPRKWFQVTDRLVDRTVRIWDTWTFFLSSALDAWSKYGVEVSEAVRQGKEARGSQSYDALWTEIHPYWLEENRAYVRLLDKLREALHAADLYISAWHGPGAIASHSLSKHHGHRAMGPIPEPVIEASQFGYGGGRFEMFKCGHANGKVYEYDINSAYPYAITQLPDLTRGEWVHVQNPAKVSRFGIYRISYAVNPFSPMANFHRPMPFFHRDKRGRISFPCVVDTWAWSPELDGREHIPGLTIHEGWEFRESSDARPFEWLRENYGIRKRYQDAGNPAQYALKIQMNSMYGKLAQRVGWNEQKRTPPKWHQLEWAGWVVSYCRRMVHHAALMAGSDLVAFETDAVFTLSPLRDKLNVGDGLGQWGETVYDDFVYMQSGCRFGLQGDEWKPKYRGFDRGSIELDSVMEALSRPPDEWHTLGTTKRFVGFGQALHQDFSEWREFQTGKVRKLRIGGEGKRCHIPKLCAACQAGLTGAETFHDCALTNPVGGQSHKHPLPWRDAQLLDTQDKTDEHKWIEVMP